MAILINGERIEAEAIREEAERMREELDKAFADEPAPAREARLQQWARENVIERLLLEQAAKADTRPLPADEVDATVKQATGGQAEAATDALRGQVELSLRARRLLDEAGNAVPPPSDADVRTFYQTHLKEFTLPDRVRAAHIVKHVTQCKPPEVAEAALRKAQEELRAGADFADLAAKHSDCPDDGGNLGWFTRGRMVEEFERAVFKMKPGETSDIFATRYGFHIVKVFDSRPAGPASFEEVEGYIRSRLASDTRNAAIEKYLDGLLAAAKVEDVA